MAVRLTINVDVAVIDQDALRRFVLESTRSFLDEVDTPADFAKIRLDEVRDADEQALVVMASAHRAVRDLGDQLERLPGLRLHGTETHATRPWPDAEDL